MAQRTGSLPVSVVIPTKNRPALLARALRTAVAQQGVAFEVIVADDGAGESEPVVAALRDPRVSLFRTGERGQVPARNMAVARADGHAVAFLDDDDWWAAPDHLAGMVAAIEGGAGLAYADGRIVREGAGGEEIPFEAHIDAASIRRDSLLLVPGIAFRRDLWARLGGFDETLPVYWDWDFYLRLAAAGTSFRHSGGDAVRISARGGTASADDHAPGRRAELDRLCAKHGLTGIVLRNHESIAQDQAAGRG